MHEELTGALANFGGTSAIRDKAADLFSVLGYHSDRSVDIGGLDGLFLLLNEKRSLTDRQRRTLSSWQSADIVFQFTTEEVQGELSLIREFDKGRAKSFLFVVAELPDRPYTRTELADMTRAVNRGLPMPVIMLYHHGAALTLAAVHRRIHKADEDKDVLERVTLVKDIHFDQPHRAHVEILADLALPRLVEEGAHDFDSLHHAWERVLDIEVLNRRFYKELFGWFQCATIACRFPDDGAGEGSTERHVIRLITRLLFVWFLKEKDLVPEALFREEFASVMLKRHEPDRTDYYRAVLQNLFFATLNTEITARSFNVGPWGQCSDSTRYRYRDLLHNSEGFADLLKQVPFVNGGLFECLDHDAATGGSQHHVDAFTDDSAGESNLHVPARMFLDKKDGLFPLFRRYKFTVEEHTPIDQELALDPELLGRVFENLLAAYNPETRETARKASGSYYTPRQVVDHMVREVVTEALAAKIGDGADQAWWRERLRYLLDHSDARNDANEFFEEAEKRTVVGAIAAFRALDPAVGSGAFPMGILQVLTLALRRLDPHNVLWEAFQKERAHRMASDAFDKDMEQRERELLEISRTFDTYRDSDFGRKLYLIQNCVFGVDIQPIACQIAKLRFFISLVVEQEANDEPAHNYGIRPLPNLETRFVAADSLLKLGAEMQEIVDGERANLLKAKLRGVRERHFNARAREEKLELRSEDDALRGQLAREVEYLETWGRDTARPIAEWDPYDQNTRADWFDPEWMFGVSGGFDVVVGNPPYIQLQANKGRLGKIYRDAGFETFVRSGDIYQLFYERGCGLLRPNTGICGYITSNSWLKAKYGKPLREWLTQHHAPISLIEAGKDVFKSAIVDASILLVRNGGRSQGFPAADLDQKGVEILAPPMKEQGEVRPRGDAPWSILSPVEWRVMDKMLEAGKPLKDWDISMYRGILTGYNEAFIVDQRTRDALIADDPRSADILKPVLRGRDISRYRAKWAELWLIDTHNGYEEVPPIAVSDYPAIKRHLDQFITRLEQRQDKGATPYNLRNCAYHEEFQKEKLFWMDLTPEGKFSYDSGGRDLLCTNSVYFMCGSKMTQLAAFLNSSLISWFVNKMGVTSGMGTPRWFGVTVETIPVPKTLENAMSLEQLVQELVQEVDRNTSPDVNELESSIESLVCRAYGLNGTEEDAIRKWRMATALPK